MISYTILIIIWVLEFLLAMALLVAMVLGKTLHERYRIVAEKETKRISRELTMLMTKQKNFADVDWGEQPPTIPLLLECLEDYHTNFNDPHWANVEKHFTEKFLLPWARENASKHSWIKRNRCIRIFLLHTEKQDREHILQKLRDKDFFIRMIAVEALGELRDKDLIPLLLKKMAQEPPSCRYIYRNVLLSFPPEDSDEIKRVYQETKDEQLRLSCLDIFSYKFYGDIHHLLREDLFSPNVDIRRKVIRILRNIASEEAVEDIIAQLQEKEPLVKSEAIEALGTLKNEKAFDKLVPMLHDQEYMVRLAVAEALLQYKQKGRQVLERQDWDLDPLAFEVARYVLTN